MKFAAVVFLALVLFSVDAYATKADENQSIGTQVNNAVTQTTWLGEQLKISLPKELDEIKIPLGVSKLDLLGRGVAEDVAVRATYDNGGGPTDSIVLLTNSVPISDILPGRLHFVTTFESTSYAIDTNRRDDDGFNLMTLSYLLRASDDPKKVYLIVLDRMPKPDLQSPMADVTIHVYVLRGNGSSARASRIYSFQEIKAVKVKNFAGVYEADLLQLEEKVLGIKIHWSKS